MASDQRRPVVVKKVKPYPFGAYLEGPVPGLRAEVMLVTTHGFLVRLKQELLRVGDYYRAEFGLPVTGPELVVRARVVKTYDRGAAAAPAGGAARSIERFAEFHFHDLPEAGRRAIGRFLAAIGQP